MIHQDSSPVSDVCVGPGGELCYARRAPLLAHVVVQASPSGRQDTWLEGFSGKLLQLFGFDGQQVFGNTGEALLRIRPGKLETIHEAPSDVRGVSFNAANRRLLWIEGKRSGQAFTAEMATKLAPEKIVARGAPFSAVWAGDDAIVLQTSQRAGRHEDRTTFSLHCVHGRLIRPLFTTYRAVPYCVGTDQAASCAIVSPFFIASDDAEARSRAREEDPKAPAEGVSGVWILKLAPDGVVARCITNRTPRTDPVFLGDRVIFASQGDRGESVLVAAGADDTRVGRVTDYVRDFAVLPSVPAIVYVRMIDGRGHLVLLDLGPLLA